jgi:multidrug transporter EmrE-like cation transporter
MFSLFVTILIFTYFTICFKWFQKFGVDNFSAIITNYLVASSLGFILSDTSSLAAEGNLDKLLVFGGIIGFLFIAVFNLVAFSTQQAGIAITVLVSKIASIVLPISFAFAIGTEVASATQIIALVLAISSLFFIINFTGVHAIKKAALLILLGIFLGQGSVDIFFSQAKKIVLDNQKELFFAIIFGMASLAGIVFSFLNKRQKFKPTPKNLLWGVILGVPNYFSLRFFFAALSELDNATAFLVLNIGIILLSTLVGVVFYKERLNEKNLVGIGLALVSLYLIFF